MKQLCIIVFAVFIALAAFCQNDNLNINPKIVTTTNTQRKQKPVDDTMAVSMTDHAKINSLEKNLFELNEIVKKLQSKLSAAENKLSADENKIASAENKLASTENKLSAAENKYISFQVVANNNNLWDMGNSKTPEGKHVADGVRIDNPACDENPNARIFITQQKQASISGFNGGEYADNSGGSLFAVYSTKFKKWFIMQNKMMVYGYSGGASQEIPVAKWTTFVAGDTFNILVVK